MSRDAPSTDTLHAAILDRISDGVVALNDNLQFTYLNDRAVELLSADRDALLGRPVWDSLADGASAVFRPPLERAVETGTEQSCEWVGPERGSSWLVRFYPDDDGLTIVVTETTDRRSHEETLGRLHEATRRMLLARSPEAVADLVSSAAVEILGLPLNAVHYYDEATDALRPVVQSPACYDVLGKAPALDSGLAWEAYQSGDAGVYPDVRAAAGVFDAETPFRSELLVPLGEYGVFIVAAQTTDEFTDTDVTLAKLLAANATVALDQVTTESLLAQQRDNLELLTRMMSHDIRNDLQVVGAIAEILGENVDGTQQEYVEKIRRNTAAAVELTTSAQELVEAMLRTETEPCPVSLRESLEDQLTRVTETATDATITVDGEIPDVTVLADEMLGSVFRNVLKNAVQHNREPDPTVTVTVEADETVVRVKVADNGPGIPDDRKESIFGRGERGMSSDGTGIGLYLVETLVDQYGGHVWVEDRERSSAGSRPPADDNDPTGAVFVIELQRE
ncbi:PAS domain-containing sensor histidine kinase [Haloarcula rara]|uniref:PAS domain-containing sensor histidine kinase n=1 Tax=Haloarcula rara TaxID=3033387 RepID=UPI0023E78D30|nr:ATP-binding protein [Halomicroarcula sp. SHR3]